MTQLNNLNRLTKHQSGLALPLTLILLFVMTLVGVATLRTTTFEENMTANSRLRQVAFNAAETTLREAENHAIGLRGQQRRVLFFGNGLVAPDPLFANVGDTCTDGYCTPAQFNSPVSNAPNGERWEDTLLDVWNDDDKHIKYSDFANTNLNLNGVLEAPRYIIEFLGNYDFKAANQLLVNNPSIRPEFYGPYRGNCRENGTLTPPNDVWPYCASDPAVYRITARATAGPRARQAVVLLQSTIRVVE